MPHFWRMSPRLSELFSKLEWYFCSRFFCATRYRLVVYGKNCLGLRGARSAAVVEQDFFSFQIFPNPRSTYLESVRCSLIRKICPWCYQIPWLGTKNCNRNFELTFFSVNRFRCALDMFEVAYALCFEHRCGIVGVVLRSHGQIRWNVTWKNRVNLASARNDLPMEPLWYVHAIIDYIMFIDISSPRLASQ